MTIFSGDGPLAGFRFGFRQFLADPINRAVLLFDFPAGQRGEGGGVQRLAAAKVKTGMMPGTTDGIASHQAIGQGAVIMAAMGGDGEDVRAAPHQQHFVFADMAGQHAGFKAKKTERDALGEVAALAASSVMTITGK